MKLIIVLLFTSLVTFGQVARPTYNPFSNGMIPFYGQNQIRPQNNYYNNNFLNRPQFPNNTNHPLNFHRPSNFGFHNNWQRPQYQNRPQQNNWQRPQIQPYQPPAPQQPSITPQPQNPQQPQTQQPTPLSTRRFHLNNGYLYGRPTVQPWVRKNLR